MRCVPFGHDSSFADGNEILLGGDLHFIVIGEFVLEEKDRIVGADGGFEKSLGVVGVTGRKNDQAGKVPVDRFDVMGVLRRNLRSGSIGAPEHDGNAEAIARHIVHLGGIGNDLVGCDEGKVEAHELDDRPKSCHCSANGKTCKRRFRDRGIENPFGAPFIEHALRDFVGAVVFSDFFSDDEDPGIALHLFIHGLS